MVPIYILLFVCWWSITVALLARLSKSDPYDYNYYVAFAATLLWPITAILISPLLFLRSAKEIRTALHNRNMLREFYKWQDENKKGNT